MWIELSSARAAFRDDAAAIPAMTLRGGAAVDGYDAPPAHDSEADEPTDTYLEAYAYWDLANLDAASWRHHLAGSGRHGRAGSAGVRRPLRLP
jgi:hypothetical protein